MFGMCNHEWASNGKVGPEYNIALGTKVPVRCSKCGLETEISSFSYKKEWPKDLIDTGIMYTQD